MKLAPALSPVHAVSVEREGKVTVICFDEDGAEQAIQTAIEMEMLPMETRYRLQLAMIRCLIPGAFR